MKTRLHTAGIGLLAAACIVACGGGGSEQAPDPNGPTTFRAFAQANQALTSPTAGAAAPAQSPAADLAEIGQRSRDWAVSALTAPGADLNANALTVPPLYFALTHAVASAARGETLAALRLHVAQPSNVNVQAGLMWGVARRVGADPAAVVSGEFMNAISMASRPGTFQPLELESLSAAAVAGNPNLRLSIYDRVSRAVSWTQVQPFNGTFAGRGVLQKVPMLRVSGPVLRHDGSNYSAVGMPLPDSTWLIQIVPDVPLADWPSSGLSAALAEVSAAIAASPVSAAVTGDVVLPVGGGGAAAGMDDRRGMEPAMDRVNANLKGLDGLGGTFLETSPASAYLNLSTEGLRYGGSIYSQFIFNPSNVHSGAVGYELVIWPPSPQPCPSAAIDLKPSYLAVMHANGSIAVLSRLAQPVGEACVQP